MSDWYVKRRFGDLPAEAAGRWGEREALYFQGQRWSYRGLADEVDRAAKALLALGVAIPTLSYTIWGWIELLMLPAAKLP